MDPATQQEALNSIYILGLYVILIVVPFLIGLGILEHLDRKKEIEREERKHAAIITRNNSGIPDFIISRRDRRCS